MKNIDIEREPFLKFDGIAITESTSAVGDKQTLSPIIYLNCICIDICIVFVSIFVFCNFLSAKPPDSTHAVGGKHEDGDKAIMQNSK